METEIDLATQVFEFLEDDFQFEYHLKSTRKNRYFTSLISYYKDNTTVKLLINHSESYFNLNIMREKDNSFTITGFLDKLIYQSTNNSLEEFEVARNKLVLYL
jgi:hypothetical protein